MASSARSQSADTVRNSRRKQNPRESLHRGHKSLEQLRSDVEALKLRPLAAYTHDLRGNLLSCAATGDGPHPLNLDPAFHWVRLADALLEGNSVGIRGPRLGLTYTFHRPNTSVIRADPR